MAEKPEQWVRNVLDDGGQDWDRVANELGASFVVEALDFDGAMRAAYQMLHNEEGYLSLREYATDVLEALRKVESSRWNSDWRYEAFLAFVADRARRIDQRNDAWDRAFNLAAPDLAVEFAFLIARMTYDLETSPVNLDEAIRMLEGTMEKKGAAAGAAERLSILYGKKGDKAAEKKWLDRSEQLETEGATLGPLLPPPLENDTML